LSTLSNFFGLGYTKHRALDDVRVNIEVFKRVCLSIFISDNELLSLNEKNEKC